MIWHNYSRIIPSGSHALFSASNYHWLGYDEDKVIDYARSMKAKERGTKLHAFAADAIRNKVQLFGKDTLARYVNDGINFGMDPEVQLYFSPFFYGTADTICVDGDKLRIHDLKTGTKVQANIKQLEIYDALYCLDYGIDPKDIQHELRIYQFDEVRKEKPKPSEISSIISKMRHFNDILTSMSEDSLL